MKRLKEIDSRLIFLRAKYSSGQWSGVTNTRAVLKRLTKYRRFAAGEAEVVKDWNLLSNWTTFKEFKDRFQLGWKTYMQDADEWMKGSCSCPSYMKKYVCKHIVGLAIRLTFVTPPIEAKTLPLNQKRKRGRPSKAKKALLVN